MPSLWHSLRKALRSVFILAIIAGLGYLGSPDAAAAFNELGVSGSAVAAALGAIALALTDYLKRLLYL